LILEKNHLSHSANDDFASEDLLLTINTLPLYGELFTYEAIKQNINEEIDPMAEVPHDSAEQNFDNQTTRATHSS